MVLPFSMNRATYCFPNLVTFLMMSLIVYMDMLFRSSIIMLLSISFSQLAFSEVLSYSSGALMVGQPSSGASDYLVYLFLLDRCLRQTRVCPDHVKNTPRPIISPAAIVLLKFINQYIPEYIGHLNQTISQSPRATLLFESVYLGYLDSSMMLSTASTDLMLTDSLKRGLVALDLVCFLSQRYLPIFPTMPEMCSQGLHYYLKLEALVVSLESSLERASSKYFSSQGSPNLGAMYLSSSILEILPSFPGFNFWCYVDCSCLSNQTFYLSLNFPSSSTGVWSTRKSDSLWTGTIEFCSDFLSCTDYYLSPQEMQSCSVSGFHSQISLLRGGACLRDSGFMGEGQRWLC